MSDVFADMSVMCAYESFQYDSAMLIIDPAMEGFSSESVKAFFVKARDTIVMMIRKIIEVITNFIKKMTKKVKNTVKTIDAKLSKPNGYDNYIRTVAMCINRCSDIASSTDTKKVFSDHNIMKDVDVDTLQYILNNATEKTDELGESVKKYIMSSPNKYECSLYLLNHDENKHAQFVKDLQAIRDQCIIYERVVTQSLQSIRINIDNSNLDELSDAKEAIRAARKKCDIMMSMTRLIRKSINYCFDIM